MRNRDPLKDRDAMIWLDIDKHEVIQAWATNPKAVAKDQPDRPKKKPRPVTIPPTPEPREAWGFPFTALAAMAEPQDAGVGDTVHRELGVGGALFKATLQTFGITCGCDARRDEWNVRYSYARYHMHLSSTGLGDAVCGYYAACGLADSTGERVAYMHTPQTGLRGYRTTLVADRTRIKNRVQGLLAQRMITPPIRMLFSKAGRVWLEQLSLSDQDRRVLDSQLRLLDNIEQEFDALDKKLQEYAYREEDAKLLMTLPASATARHSRFWRRSATSRASETAITPRATWGLFRRRVSPGITATTAESPRPATQLPDGCSRKGPSTSLPHPGPLGVFFRRLAKRKNRNVAVSAVARKLVTIAFLMLKNKEPYRYAVAKRVHEKFTHLRNVATGQRSKPVRVRPATLPAACAKHELPPIRTLPQAAAW